MFFCLKLLVCYSVFPAKLRKEKGTCKLSHHNFPSQREMTSPRLSPLLVKQFTDANLQCFGYQMQPSYCQVIASVHYAIYRLSFHSKTTAQFGITYVFFIITLRRFSCDSYFTFFIVVLL